MNEVILVFAGMLFTITIAAALEYYRQINRVHKEYNKAKEAIDDIVISFNSQLKREAEKIKVVKYKLNAASSRSEKALQKIEELKKSVIPLKPNLGVKFAEKKEIQEELNRIEQNMRDVMASQEKISAKVSMIEERIKRITKVPEPQVEAVIPIKREKALAPLTETELSVLEMLALEGTKTAPQVRDRIQLSREHTARLMKKLYEEGYLERDTSSIPFKYRIKEEMKKLLKKTGMEIR